MIGFRSQMYVELEGDKSKSGDLPASVFLELRHLSASYFRDGRGDIKEFRQPLGAKRKFKFNRFAITNTTKCWEEKRKGNGKYQTRRTSRGIYIYILLDLNCQALVFIVEAAAPLIFIIIIIDFIIIY